MRSPDVQKRLESEGARFIPSTPAQFASFQRDELAKMGQDHQGRQQQGRVT